MFIRAIEKVVAGAEAYQKWYARSRYGRVQFPRCPFCGANKYILRGSPRLVNYRYQMSRVHQNVQCSSCGMLMTASRYDSDKRWTFYRV